MAAPLESAIGWRHIDGCDRLLILVEVRVAQGHALFQKIIARLRATADALRDALLGTGGESTGIQLGDGITHQTIVVNKHPGCAAPGHKLCFLIDPNRYRSID